MSKCEDEYQGTENEYIDDLIRLVYKQDRLRETKEIIEKSNEPLTPEEEASAARIQERMKAGMKEADEKKKAKKTSRVLRILPKIMEIAACLIVFFAVGTTIAVAKNESVRSAILKLLISIDQKEGVVDIRFEDVPEEGFDVPADWLGEYYPSGISKEFTVVYMSPYKDLPSVEYNSPDGKIIIFDENNLRTGGTQGTEDGVEVSTIMINDRPAYMLWDDTPGDTYYCINWSNDDKWFTLETSYMTKEETIDLVKSVRKIIPKDKK